MTSERSNSYIDELTSESDISDMPDEPSEIIEFFSGLVIFVTGVTGFLGKLIVEKLLRSCPDISKIYVMVRKKKGKNTVKRFQQTFDDVRLWKEQPNFLTKVIMLEGDISEDNLGLSPEDRKRLSDVNVVFHAAATVKFDETIEFAATANVRGIMQMLSLAKEMPNLKAFVHVSTAFSQCCFEAIEERHYKPPIDSDTLLAMINACDQEKLKEITPALITPWPNTYSFTKALGENAVLRNGTGIPVCIVRPSIVVSTFEDPLSGWTNNLYGATGVTVGAAAGLLHTLNCTKDNNADIIPADYATANIIAAAWDIGQKNINKNTTDSRKSDSDTNELEDAESIPIYNCVSSCQNPITWKYYMHLNAYYGKKVSPKKAFWSYNLLLIKNTLIFNVLSFLFHIIPAVIVDSFAYLTGRKPMLLKLYGKIHTFGTAIRYFAVREWKFRNDRVQQLWEKMNERDRRIFNFNVQNINWENYCFYNIRGIRLYMLNDSFDTVEAGNIKQRKLQVATYTIITSAALLTVWLFVSILSYIWSFCPLAHQ